MDRTGADILSEPTTLIDQGGQTVHTCPGHIDSSFTKNLYEAETAIMKKKYNSLATHIFKY